VVELVYSKPLAPLVTSKVTITSDPAQTGLGVTLVTEIVWAEIMEGAIPSKTTNKAKILLGLLYLRVEPVKFNK
jgi:hypothetical protein